MWSAIPVQERPARNALTVELNCANRTRKPVARVARSSAAPVFSAIKRSTQSLSQRATDEIENERALSVLLGTEQDHHGRIISAVLVRRFRTVGGDPDENCFTMSRTGGMGV